MRLLKFILAGLLALFALLAGLFATAVVALTGLMLFLTRRLWRRAIPPRPAPRPTPARNSAPEAIDVVATEVPADRGTKEPFRLQ